MIEFLGFFYEVAKDIKKYYEWKEEEKLVNSGWLEKSGFKEKLEADGITLRWSKPDRLGTSA